MRPYHVLWACLLGIGLTNHAFAQKISLQENAGNAASTDFVSDGSSSQNNSSDPSNTEAKHPRIEALKDLKNITRQDLKVNETAAQADSVKDPLKPSNREF